MGKFILTKNSESLYLWIFESSNGQRIGTNERYTTKQAALRSIAVLQREAALAVIEDESSLR